MSLNYRAGRKKPIRLIVLHSMEAPETATTAEACANYFRTGNTTASVHVCADNNSLVRVVADEDTAFHAIGVNDEALGIEQAGYARQTRAEWLDPYGLAMLDLVASQVAYWCRRWNIPPVRLTVAQIKDGVSRGLCSHADVEKAFPSSGHWDPGPDYPWDHLLARVAAHSLPPEDEDDMPKDLIVKDPDSTTQYVVAHDLSSKTGIATGTDLTALKATGNYVDATLTAKQLLWIPNAT